jgi:hypothetical protein
MCGHTINPFEKHVGVSVDRPMFAWGQTVQAIAIVVSIILKMLAEVRHFGVVQDAYREVVAALQISV